MEVIRDPQQMQALALRHKKDDHRIGIVPTMGALHDGHLELVKTSRTHCDITIVSLFVNPKQFNSEEDLDNYPRTFKQDLDKLQRHHVTYVFAPEDGAMYPDGYHFRLSEDDFSTDLCGQDRPGHFDGVLTVVMKLLQISQADRAYFGEKDFQQYRLIEKMAQAFFLPTEICPVPTVRDHQGLALSSRNQRLNEEQLQLAQDFAKKLSQSVSQKISSTYLEQSLKALGVDVDYIEDKDDRRFAAVRINDVRLIDNVAL